VCRRIHQWAEKPRGYPPILPNSKGNDVLKGKKSQPEKVGRDQHTKYERHGRRKEPSPGAGLGTEKRYPKEPKRKQPMTASRRGHTLCNETPQALGLHTGFHPVGISPSTKTALTKKKCTNAPDQRNAHPGGEQEHKRKIQNKNPSTGCKEVKGQKKEPEWCPNM